MRPDGAVVSPVVLWKNAVEGDIDFSADGANMAFTSNGNGKWQVFLSNAEGLKPVCITDGAANNVSPHFAPAGKKLAFLSDKTSFGGTRDLWVYDFASASFAQLTKDSKVADFCWIDPQSIVYSGGDSARLFLLDLATLAARPLVPVLRRDYGETAPRLIGSNRSLYILYTREYRDGTKRIYRVKPDGTGDEAVVNSGGQDWLE